MPIIKSAKKRVRIAEKATVRNVKTKKSLRTAIKEFQSAVSGGDKKKIATTQSAVMSAIDTAAKKNVMSRNKASRQKSRLSATAKAAGSAGPVASKAKDATPAKATKKPAVKPVGKKASAKPAAKKAPAKKTVTKKK